MGLSIEQETFTPVGDVCLLRPIDPASKTKGGLELPETFKKSQQPRAEVIAVGKGRLLESGMRNEIDIKPGDMVVLSGGVHAIELEGQEKMMICSYSQIMGIIR